MLLLQNKYNIIVALISLGGGLLVPHLIMLVWDSNNNSSNSSSSSSNANVVLLSHWNDQWINLRRWIQTFTTTIAPATTTTSIHHAASFPLDMYQNKTHYLDATVRNNERKSSVLLDTTTNTTTSSSHAPTQSQQYPCTPERRWDFLHDTKIPGYHVLCFTTVADTHNDAGENNIHHHHPASYTLTVYRYGVMDETNSKQNIYTTTIIPHQMSWSQFQSDIISNHIIFRRRDNTHRTTHQQPYALFTMDGQRIIDKDSIEGKNDTVPWFVEVMAQQLGMVLLYEGGQFVWPGVRVGYERHVALYSIMPPTHSPNNHNMEEHRHHHRRRRHPAKPNNMNVTLVTLSLSPLVLSVHGFLSVDECRHIQTMATPTMAYSDVVLMDHDAGRPASDFRTSQTTFLDANGDAILTDIDYRTASLTRVPRNHQEPVQVLRYGISEKYSAHYDYFNPKSYQNDIDTLRLIRHGTRNRFATVFWYLSTVPEGGETIFPRAYGQYERSNSDCDTGLKVRPEVGKVIIFYNMKMDGTIDPQSLHGACPVRQGIKWAANKWIWNEPMSYVPP